MVRDYSCIAYRPNLTCPGTAVFSAKISKAFPPGNCGHGPMIFVLAHLVLVTVVASLPADLLDAGFQGSAEIIETATHGRGLVTSSDVLVGDELLSVPLRHIFSLHTLKEMNLEPLETSNLPMADILASILAASRHKETLLKKLLPKEVESPLFFGTEDWQFVDNLVSADLLRSLRDEYLHSWQLVKDSGIEELDFRWAHAVLRSRGHSIRLKTSAGAWHTVWGLVPLADFLNMAAKSEANVDCGTRYPKNSSGLNGTFTCTARRDLKEGDMLLSEYMSRSMHRTRAIVLREYGFVPEDAADGLSFLPTGCQNLICAVHVSEVEQLESQVADPGAFLTAALQTNSVLSLNSSVNEALKQLAQYERKLLQNLAKEYDRRQLPKMLYKEWRSRPNDLWPLSAASSKSMATLRKLQDPEILHTIAWDQAVSDAGQLLLSDWDDLLAMELLLSHHDFPAKLEVSFRHRRKDLIQQIQGSFEAPNATLLAWCCAFATQALLNDYAWPISSDEQELLKKAEDMVRSMYYPVDSMHLSFCPVATALQRERRWEIDEAIPSCGYTGDTRVDELYTLHPYPSWRRFGSLKSKQKRVKRSLIAGAGTGKSVLAHLEHYSPDEIVAVDLSRRSLQVAKRQLLALGVKNVTYLQCDLTKMASLDSSSIGKFDVIESIGVLHHLPDPSMGFAVLKHLLAPEGVLVVGLYSRFARRSIPVMRELAQQSTKEHFRDWLVEGGNFLGRSLGEELKYREEFLAEFSLGSRSNFEDLLFHPVEHSYELPEVEALLSAHGLRFSGLRVPAGGSGDVPLRWSRFFSAGGRVPVEGWPEMPLLAFLHRIETEQEPLLFTNMYVFTASSVPTRARFTSILGDNAISRWSEDPLEDAAALPLPFEEDWKPELLSRAIAAYCSRVLHLLTNSTARWISAVPLEAWLEAKVAFGPHAANVAQSLRTADAANEYCTQVQLHFLEPTGANQKEEQLL